ncbi:hypothetical protein GCM10009800_30670 [Nocardiopsis rhodophaea]
MLGAGEPGVPVRAAPPPTRRPLISDVRPIRTFGKSGGATPPGRPITRPTTANTLLREGARPVDWHGFGGCVSLSAVIRFQLLRALDGLGLVCPACTPSGVAPAPDTGRGGCGGGRRVWVIY